MMIFFISSHCKKIYIDTIYRVLMESGTTNYSQNINGYNCGYEYLNIKRRKDHKKRRERSCYLIHQKRKNISSFLILIC